MALSGVSFSDQVREAALRYGFDAVGIARASEPLGADFHRYEAFLQEGKQGEMNWLADHAAVRARLDGEGILAGAKSVVCVARRYHGDGEHERTAPSKGGRDARPSPSGKHEDDGPQLAATEPAGSPDVVEGIARYARGRDYHKFLRRRLRRLATFVRSLGTPEQPVRARPLCDDAPILERAWAVRAGLGFVGKNGMLIVPGLGSMVLLGEVVTTLDLLAGGAGPMNGLIQERCGACTRCLQACPTNAFSSAFVLDPRRCVSYLTIELRTAMPLELREGVGPHLFGCDDCQTACPFTAGIGANAPLDVRDGNPFAPLERWSRARLAQLLSLTDAEWHALFDGTPLRRAGRNGIARNAAIVLGNRGDPSALPALREAASAHDDPVVREAASWGVIRIESQRKGPSRA